MCELQVIRTIHPVGQGAFYSEVLHRKGVKDNYIIYDCGVLPYSKRLDDEINGLLKPQTDIDILFISHFHKDHVNGIKTLAKNRKIKKVVVPQIDGYEWLYILENLALNDEVNVYLVQDIMQYFQDTEIIQIEPTEKLQNNFEKDNKNNRQGLYRKSGEPININKDIDILWTYIPLNNLIRGDLNQLKTNIEKIEYNGRYLKIDDLQDPTALIKCRDELQKVYKDVFKDGNAYSMCLLSSPQNFDDCSTQLKFVKQDIKDKFIEYYKPSDEEKHIQLCRKGCLYCGDANFIQNGTLNNLQQKLKDYQQHIGTLQLPHHGSINNFNIDLLNWIGQPIITFASYGINNRYNHPSNHVIGTAETFGPCYRVTENYKSIFTKRIDVYKK